MFYHARRRLIRRAHLARDRLLHRIDRRKLLATLQAIGVEKGTSVCVHSALSEVGYFDGGPQMVAETLLEAVGSRGTLLMPTYSTAGSMASWLESGEVFDVRTTPSQTGRLTEVFRLMPGTTRSLHPTNSLAAQGPDAAFYLDGHETAPHVYGEGTPYARMAQREDAFILMISTSILSLSHYVQDRARLPNLYQDKVHPAALIDWSGKRKTVSVRALSPYTNYFIAIPPATGTAPDWALIHDFILGLPKSRAPHLRSLGYRFEGYPRLWRRRDEYSAAGFLKVASLGRSEIALVRAKPLVESVVVELVPLIERYRDWYDVEAIRARKLPFY